MKDFKKLIVWQKSMDLVENVFQIVGKMDMSEKISLGSQISRSAVSIPSNIAEGAGRGTDKEFARFLDIAMGSAFELETQLMILGRTNPVLAETQADLVLNTQKIQKMLSGLKRSIKTD
jgi:four helix bundle protein